MSKADYNKTVENIMLAQLQEDYERQMKKASGSSDVNRHIANDAAMAHQEIN